MAQAMKKRQQVAPTPLLMTEQYWANTHLSIVRHYGRIKFNQAEYIIVDKRGRDVFECSHEAERLGRAKAIEPGEPCDLVWVGLVPAYRALGRDRIIAMIESGKSFDEIEEEAKHAKKKGVRNEMAKESAQTTLFEEQDENEGKTIKTCRQCKNRQRWMEDHSTKVSQYCRVIKSNRTSNGLKKIKVTNKACALFEEEGGEE